MTTARIPGAPVALGLDFGTTNTVGARLIGDRVESLRFDTGDTVFRSALAFWTHDAGRGLEHFHEAGPSAIAQFIDHPIGCRFLQSLKTFAASAAFRQTLIHGRLYTFEKLMAAFLEKVCDHAALTPRPLQLVTGRPVTFAGSAPDAGLAEARYDAAFRATGFTDVHYVYEPVAAAYYFAQGLTRDATVLVADFGGGTSDFSIVRFAVGRDGLRATPLAQTGVGIAGDRFDYRIIDRVISPRLGKGSTYRSFGKVLDIPVHYYANFARWNQLAIMKAPETLRELADLARASDAPDLLETFIEVIEEDLGYPLYEAVNRLKAALSSAETAHLSFHRGGLAIEADIARADFEGWIAADLDRIEAAMETALATAGLTPTAVDRVFLTGGTSFVPALRRRFTARFGAAKVETGDEFMSIAYGLALIAAAPDMARWTVREAAAA